MNDSQDRNLTVLAKAVRIVTPSEKEVQRLSFIADDVKKRLQRSFDKLEVKPEIRLGGSYAKGTWLPGTADIDFFLLYPVEYSREKLETEAIGAAKAAVKGYRTNLRFAEHPYVETFVDEARVNLVPCYKVKSGEWQSAADRSPFHTEYIQKHFDDKLRQETRLLKKFVRTTGVYGAEVKVHGFSGYVCEVLTLKLGSFQSVLSRLSNVKGGDVLAIEAYDEDFVRSFKSSIIILDPVDSTRNLGTAISTENLSKLILQSRNFLARPSLAFFEKSGRGGGKKPSKDLLQRILVISFKTGPRSVDVLWGQLYKSLDSLVGKIEFCGFEVLRKRASSNEIDQSAFIFLLRESKISKYQLRKGPDVFRGEDFEKYLEKNQKRATVSWLDSEGRVESLFEKEKDANDIFKLMKAVLKNKKTLDSLGLSKAIREEITGFTIQSGAEVIGKSSRNTLWLRNDVISLTHEDEILHATS